MDGLGWDETQVVTNSSSPLWIHNPEENNILVSSNSNFCSYGGKMDLTTVDIFNQIQELHKAPTSQVLVNSERTQEGITEIWRNTSNHQEIYSTAPLINNKACFGTVNADHQHQQQARINAKQDGVSVTASLDSLDCLLSETNSNTDTSIEDDDGISMIFSDCRALWNNLTTNNNTSTTTTSSGESENNITCNARNKETHDETASQSSLDQAKSLQPKSVFPTKRNYSIMEGGFTLISETNNNPGAKSKKLKQEKRPSSSNINFQQPSNSSVSSSIEEPDPEAIAQMKEMIYRAAAFRPVNLGLEMVEKPKRKNVRISTDPQTVAARQRRERISERIRVLQRLVPGGSKMDTASMLDEAANYLKFLRSQVKALENLGHSHSSSSTTNVAFSSLPFHHSFPMLHTQFPFLQNPNHLHLP